jgi:hypothetical protein
MLLHIAHGQLHLEIVGMVPGNLFKTEKDGLQSGQVVHGLDLLIQTLKLVVRIGVLRSHDVILH